ncbi:MAG: Helix-hairpin-helix repeat-containing competence protein ComEA [uncultured bacterium]|nr:MAG: Helix-hairpin-helix repeat-containing competence protein ComEA [uncultured bacterium]
MSFYRFFIIATVIISVTSGVFAGEIQHAQQKADTKVSSVSSKVNLNKATAEELAKVQGLNASKAKAILSYRKKHGDFKSMDDLKTVRGFKRMSDQTFKTITDQFTLG